MPNIKSQMKRTRQAKKQASKNKKAKSQIKMHISNFGKALAKKDEKRAKEILDQTIRMLDKAANKGIIHKNKAANKKSRLTRKLNALKAVPKKEPSKSAPTKSPSAKPKK